MADSQHLRCCAARHAGSSPAPSTDSNISSFERGIRNPSLKVIERLAHALDMPIRNFFKIIFNKKFIIVIVVLFYCIGFGASKLFNKAQSPSKKYAHQSVELKELSREEYAVVKEEFLGLINTHDPKFALTELRERIKTDHALLRSCHALVHEIGHAAYEKYGDFGEAMKYQDEICNSGYLHGIIETHFSKSADVFTAMQGVCNPYPLGKYLSWECYHGVGHGVMYYTSNDLPKSLKLCDRYESSFARTNCANGVFMENFNTDQKIHPSKFLKESDSFYPCQEQTGRHKGICYLYSPTYYLSLHKNDYVAALDWCNNAELFYQDTCARGVGSQAIKENINNPKFVEEICISGKSSQVSSCVSGMVDLYINHYGSLEPARKLCEQLEISNRQTCYNSIQSSASLF